MPELKDILKDKTAYPDNLAINLGNNIQVNLGQIRSLSSADQAAIVKKEEELTARSTTLETESARLKKAQENTANLYVLVNNAMEGLKAGRYDDPAVKQLFGSAAIPGVTANNNNDPYAVLAKLESDNVLGPVVQAMKLIRAEAVAAQDAVNKNIQTQKLMATNYMNGVLEDRYDRIVPRDKQDKITIEALIKDAVANNQFSTDSTPNIRWAYAHLTAADTATAREAEIRADERKKLTKELEDKSSNAAVRGDNSIFVAPPTTFGLDVHNRSGAAPTPFKSLDEAFAAAAKDTSIWQNDQV